MCLDWDGVSALLQIMSGTEEQFIKLEQLLEDINSYNCNFEMAVREKEHSLLARKGEEMCLAAMTSMSGVAILHYNYSNTLYHWFLH